MDIVFVPMEVDALNIGWNSGHKYDQIRLFQLFFLKNLKIFGKIFLYFATLELLLAHRNSCTSVSTAVICFWQSFKTTVPPIWRVFIDYCLSIGTSPTLSNRVMPCWLLPLITLKKWVLRMLSTTKISFVRFFYAILWKENEIRVRIQKKKGEHLSA